MSTTRTKNTMAKKKNDRGTINDLQNTTYKTKDLVTRTPLKTGDELRCFGRLSSSCSTCGTHSITLVTRLFITLKKNEASIK